VNYARKDKKMRQIIVFIFITIFIVFTGSTVSSSKNINGFVDVTDGDTIRFGMIKIRIWGLDAPEMNTDAGKRSKAELRAIVSGKEVTCEPDGTKSYDRVVAKCFVDGHDIAVKMIELGLAKPYCKFSRSYYNEAAIKGGVDKC